MSKVDSGALAEAPQDFLDRIADSRVREDCRWLWRLLLKITGKQGCMWASSIVGFAAGREPDWFVLGFSPGRNELTIYMMGGFHEYPALLEALGPHRLGAACLYLKSLREVDLDALEGLLKQAYHDMLRKFG